MKLWKVNPLRIMTTRNKTYVKSMRSGNVTMKSEITKVKLYYENWNYGKCNWADQGMGDQLLNHIHFNFGLFSVMEPNHYIPGSDPLQTKVKF